MILYFSATGNGKYISEQISSKTGEKCISIVDCINKNKYYFSNEKMFGIVSPTYFWRLPRIVSNYLEKIKINNCEYTFFLASYGKSTGQIGSMARNIVSKNGHSFDAYYSVVMPDTWTPIFNLTNKKRLNKCLENGKRQLLDVIDNICLGKKGDFIEKKIPKLIAKIPSAYMYSTQRKTKNLSVNKKLCISCGLCEKKCPVNAIEIEYKTPVWKVQECEMCLGCLHRCPKFAISYGKGKTNRHGQYKNPYTSI